MATGLIWPSLHCLIHLSKRLLLVKSKKQLVLCDQAYNAWFTSPRGNAGKIQIVLSFKLRGPETPFWGIRACHLSNSWNYFLPFCIIWIFNNQTKFLVGASAPTTAGIRGEVLCTPTSISYKKKSVNIFLKTLKNLMLMFSGTRSTKFVLGKSISFRRPEKNF